MKLSKDLIIGLTLGIILTTSIPLLAKTTQYILTKSNAKLIIDTKPCTLKNEILITKNAIVYVPLKDVSNALALTLSVNSGTININTNDSEKVLKEDPTTNVPSINGNKPLWTPNMEGEPITLKPRPQDTMSPEEYQAYLKKQQEGYEEFNKNLLEEYNKNKK